MSRYLYDNWAEARDAATYEECVGYLDFPDEKEATK